MNREQLIEKAAVAVVTARTDTPSDVARSVVNALLPQVSTVEELRKVAVDTVLVDRNGDPLKWASWRNPQFYIRNFGPLTVVWSPS